jgi:hypothetical protein
MRQQQFIFATKADDPFVLGMRLWQMSVRYISQCLCSPHLLQRLAVCYLVLGWLFNRVWMMFQRRLFNLCNHFRTHSLATVHVGITYSLLDCLSIYMFLITVRQFSQKACGFKGDRRSLSVCGITISRILQYTGKIAPDSQRSWRSWT